MGYSSKEQKAYNNGLARALDLVKAGGTKALESEIKVRGAYDIPVGINHYMLNVAARKLCKRELMIVATAMAMTMRNEMSFPAEVISKYLKAFNDKCDLYREDPEAFDAAEREMDRDFALNITIAKFMNE